MGKIAKCLTNMIQTRKDYEDFKKASEKALSIFGNQTGITLEYIEKMLKGDEWSYIDYFFCNSCGRSVYSGENINWEFTRLSHGFINRDQFRENCKKTISLIETTLDELRIHAEQAENNFYKEYEIYFNEKFKKDFKKDEDFASIFLIPKVKEIIIKFMMS